MSVTTTITDTHSVTVDDILNMLPRNSAAAIEIRKLIEDSEFLDALRGAGVDNWHGYDIAVEMYKETH